MKVRVRTALPHTSATKSISPGIGWAPHAESFHFVDQSGAWQSEPGGGTSRAAKLSIGALAGGENFFANLVFQRGVRILE